MKNILKKWIFKLQKKELIIFILWAISAVMVNEKVYETKTVILATGVEYGKQIGGEKEYLGKGVGYCATCDAPLYKGKTVTIIGYNKRVGGGGGANSCFRISTKS